MAVDVCGPLVSFIPWTIFSLHHAPTDHTRRLPTVITESWKLVPYFFQKGPGAFIGREYGIRYSVYTHLIAGIVSERPPLLFTARTVLVALAEIWQLFMGRAIAFLNSVFKGQAMRIPGGLSFGRVFSHDPGWVFGWIRLGLVLLDLR